MASNMGLNMQHQLGYHSTLAVAGVYKVVLTHAHSTHDVCGNSCRFLTYVVF